MLNFYIYITLVIVFTYILFIYINYNKSLEMMTNYENNELESDCESDEDIEKLSQSTLNIKNQNDLSKGTLYLYPESQGFDVKDFGGFPPADIVRESFHTIAVIANHASGDEMIKKQFNNPQVIQLQQESGLPVVRWMAYYFGVDSALFCDCNIKGCTLEGTPQNCANCKQELLKQLHKDVQQYNLTGILFDDEVGDPTCIVDAMESVKSIYPTMQLGWTKSLGNAKEMNPSNLGKLDWNICLGQAYTDTTTNLYNGSCNFADDFWEQILKTKYDSATSSSRGVPMVCGSGNCQEINGCIDERMDGKQIGELLSKRPPPDVFKWRNFGIWYGTYSNPSNCNKKGKCCSVNNQENTVCETECCDNWAMM